MRVVYACYACVSPSWCGFRLCGNSPRLEAATFRRAAPQPWPSECITLACSSCFRAPTCGRMDRQVSQLHDACNTVSSLGVLAARLPCAFANYAGVRTELLPKCKEVMATGITRSMAMCCALAIRHGASFLETTVRLLDSQLRISQPWHRQPINVGVAPSPPRRDKLWHNDYCLKHEFNCRSPRLALYSSQKVASAMQHRHWTSSSPCSGGAAPCAMPRGSTSVSHCSCGCAADPPAPIWCPQIV